MARRIIWSWVAAGMLAAVVFMTSPAQARPAAQSTTCQLSATVTFDPGLTFTARDQAIKARGTLASCSGGGVTGGSLRGKGGGNLSCTSGTAKATATIRWNTGQSSTLRLRVDVSSGSATGKVTAGKFAGEPASGDLTISPITGDCFNSPVTKASADGSVSL
jgi:hypothetical protein